MTPDAGLGIQLQFPDGALVRARLERVDPRADLALLSFEVWPGAPQPVEIADAWPARGAAVRVHGYPGGVGPHDRTLRAVGPGGHDDGGVPTWWVTGPINNGDSGCGVFHAGRLVGVVWGKTGHRPGSRDPGTHGLCVGLPEVRAFVGDDACLRRKARPQPPREPYYKPQFPPPEAPPAPRPDRQPAPPRDDGKLLERLEAIRGRLDERIDGLQGRLKDLDAGERFKGVLDRLDAVQGRLKELDASDRLRAVQDALKGLQDSSGDPERLKPVLDRLGTLRSVVEKLEASPAREVIRETALPALWQLLGLPALGAAGPAGLAAWLVLRRLRSRVRGRVIVAREAPVQPQPQQPGQVIVTQAPPLPQAPPRVEREYVPYQAASPELEALKRAMDELVKRHPGALETVETLKNYARQIEAGLPKPK